MVSCVVPCALINSSRDKSSRLYTVYSTHTYTYNTHVRGYIIMIWFIYYIIYLITKHTRLTIDVKIDWKAISTYTSTCMLRLRYSVFGQYRWLRNNIIIINSLVVVVILFILLCECCTRRHTIYCILCSVLQPQLFIVARSSGGVRIGAGPWYGRNVLCVRTNERPTDRLYRWRPRRIISSRRSRGLFIIIISF